MTITTNTIYKNFETLLDFFKVDFHDNKIIKLDDEHIDEEDGFFYPKFDGWDLVTIHIDEKYEDLIDAINTMSHHLDGYTPSVPNLEKIKQLQKAIENDEEIEFYDEKDVTGKTYTKFRINN